MMHNLLAIGTQKVLSSVSDVPKHHDDWDEHRYSNSSMVDHSRSPSSRVDHGRRVDHSRRVDYISDDSGWSDTDDNFTDYSEDEEPEKVQVRRLQPYGGRRNEMPPSPPPPQQQQQQQPASFSLEQVKAMLKALRDEDREAARTKTPPPPPRLYTPPTEEDIALRFTPASYHWTLLADRNALQAEEGSFECQQQVPGKIVTRTEIGAAEQQFLNQAQNTARPAGEGVSTYPFVAPVPAMAVVHLEALHDTPDSLSWSNANDAGVYKQNFMSMSAVPAVPVGEWTDPVTGVVYEAFESAMPPPDTDYYEMSHSTGKNTKLGFLQGGGAGFSNDAPQPERQELLADDFSMHADFTINQYGNVLNDAQVWRAAVNAERNNRFKRDDELPDGMDGQENLDQIPANRDGIYNEKVRIVPRMLHTNRGNQEESTFRSGMNPDAGGIGQQQHSAQTWTHFPQELGFNDYIGPHDGTNGVEAQAYQPVAGDGFDRAQTQRTSMQMPVPLAGAALADGGAAGQYVPAGEDIEEPTAQSGLDVVSSQLFVPGSGGGHGAQYRAAGQDVEEPTAQSGLDVVSSQLFVPGAGGAQGLQYRAAGEDIEEPHAQSGLDVVASQLFVPGSGGAQGLQYRAAGEDIEEPTTQSGLDVVASQLFVMGSGGAQGLQYRPAYIEISKSAPRPSTAAVRLTVGGGGANQDVGVYVDVEERTSTRGETLRSSELFATETSNAFGMQYRPDGGDLEEAHAQRGLSVKSSEVFVPGPGGAQGLQYRAASGDLEEAHAQRGLSVESSQLFVPGSGGAQGLQYRAASGDLEEAHAQRGLSVESSQLFVPGSGGAQGLQYRAASGDLEEAHGLRGLSVESSQLFVPGSGGAQGLQYRAASGDVEEAHAQRGLDVVSSQLFVPSSGGSYAPRERETVEATNSRRDLKFSDYGGAATLATGGGGAEARAQQRRALAHRDVKFSDYSGAATLATGGGGGEVHGKGVQAFSRSKRQELLKRLQALAVEGGASGVGGMAARGAVTKLSTRKDFKNTYVAPVGPNGFSSGNMEGAIPGMVRQNGLHRPSVEYAGNVSSTGNTTFSDGFRMDMTYQLTDEYDVMRVGNMTLPLYTGAAAAQAWEVLQPQPCPRTF